MVEVAKIKHTKVKSLRELFPDIGQGQAARGSNESHWDRSMIAGDMRTVGGYSPTEGPIVAFADELSGSIPGAERVPADGNLRALALLDCFETDPKAGEWDVPVLIYPAGLNNEERERIRNRCRDTTQTKTQHDYYCWALKTAKKNPLMGDTDVCRLIGPRPIRSQWPNAVVPGSTYVDPNGLERFKPDLPLDSKDGMSMLVNKQGPIQEVTRVRHLPGFAQEFFLLHPSESKHKSFGSSRNWSQAWSQDLRARPDLNGVQSLKELLEKYPESKLGSAVAVHAASGAPSRKNARGEGKGAHTSVERERLATTMAQTATVGGNMIATVIKIIGRESGHVEGSLDFLEAIAPEVTLSPKGQKLLAAFTAGAVKAHTDAIAAATAAEAAETEKRQKAEAAAVKKAKKG